MPEVPRIARRAAVHPGLAGRADAELGAGGAPERDQAGSFKPRKELRIDAVAVVAVQPRSRAGREIDRLATEVLDQEGHAGEGAVGQTGLDRPPGPVGLLVDDSCNSVIGACRSLQREVQQLARGDLSVANECGQTETVELAVFVEAHRCNVARVVCACRVDGRANGGASPIALNTVLTANLALRAPRRREANQREK